MTLRNHLRRFRFEAGEMTQQELADRACVTRQTIISIEKGNYSPSVELALRIALVFGTAVEALFELADSGEGNKR
jgi:putative transcriptional regulator